MKTHVLHSWLINKTIKIAVIIAAIFITCINANVNAQQYFDSKGNDFWLTFMPNFHPDQSDVSDSLFIFITSDKPTQGRIDKTDKWGTKTSETFSITDPSKVYVYKVYYDGYELLGFNESGVVINPTGNQNEVTSPQSFHITSDDEITVYALNQAKMTSDAFLVLPTDVLGNDYYVMAYHSDDRRNMGRQATPSQFAIVATEDNTSITIIPSTETYKNGKNTQKITLNKGQSYLVQALITQTSDVYRDLTGTKINSTKPIALFGGHQRTIVPVEESQLSSRDHLAEEMPPIKTWGKNAFLVPYAQPAGITTLGHDLFRVMAAYNNTDIYINGQQIGTLDAGEFYEDILVQPGIVTANAPILVAQYKKTSGAGSSAGLGDPFMMLIPPMEQFMNDYKVINNQVYESGVNRVYTEQYISIVSPDSTISTVTMDGVTVNSGYFKPIPSSGYSYSIIPVTDGTHIIKAQGRVGVYIYGFGEANSYGYIGGMSLRPIDVKPPEIAAKDSCYSIRGLVADTSISDSKIATVSTNDTLNVNVSYTIQPFKPYAPTVSFSAKLVDKRLDGQFSITAKDSAGMVAPTKVFNIPGFTLGLDSYELSDTLPTISDFVKLNKKFCYNIVVHNYGKFSHDIKRVSMKLKEYSVTYKTPSTIKPDERDTITVCFLASKDSTYKDSLIISDDCGNRTVMKFAITAFIDKNPPKVQKISDGCDTLLHIVFTDSLLTDLGIQTVKVLDSTNCQILGISNTVDVATIDIRIKDPFADAFYKVEATDSLNHKTTFTDTIPGFTLDFIDLMKGDTLKEFGDRMIGTLSCDSVQLYNYGRFAINLTYVMMAHNIFFSVPQSQLPKLIKPLDTVKIYVCFNPQNRAQFLRDTLIVSYRCKPQLIPFTGNGLGYTQTGISKCNIPVTLVRTRVTNSYYIASPYPLPIKGKANFNFGLGNDGNASINVYNIYGVRKKTIINEFMKAGDYEVEFDASDLEPDVYMYDLVVDGIRRQQGRFIVVR